jgi:hypothetical protein
VLPEGARPCFNRPQGREGRPAGTPAEVPRLIFGRDLAAGALAKTAAYRPAQGLTCGTCRTIVVKKDKCLVIYRFSRGRLQSVARGLQRHPGGPPPGRAVVSCGEAECAGQFFRIWPDATISIARITDSDAASGGNGALKHRNFAESYRLVTAGDGRWTQGPCIWGYLRQAPSGHQGHTTYNARIATSIQEERPHQCPHALQRPSRY